MVDFDDYKYETNNGTIIQLRLDKPTGAQAGTAPEGAIDLGIHGIVSGNRPREFGVHPRGVRLRRERGVAPNLFSVYKFLPVLTAEALETAAFTEGATITISGIAWTVTDKVGESLN